MLSIIICSISPERLQAVKRNIPKGQRWRYVVGCALVGAVIGGVIV